MDRGRLRGLCHRRGLNPRGIFRLPVSISAISPEASARMNASWLFGSPGLSATEINSSCFFAARERGPRLGSEAAVDLDDFDFRAIGFPSRRKSLTRQFHDGTTKRNGARLPTQARRPHR